MLKFENMISVTEILRNGKVYFDDLSSGEQKQILVMKNSQPVAVLLSPDEYDRIASGKDLIAQHQIMRMNIMNMFNSVSSPFDTAYVYAWYKGVYPLLHDGADWHKPFESCFKFNADQLEAILNVLSDRWDEKKPMTFYQLEDHFGARSKREGIDRVTLLLACRYFFLESCPDGLDGNQITRFDKKMWETLVTNGKCPSEAFSIVRPPSDFKIYFM